MALRNLVRRNVDRLDDLADRALLDQFARIDSGFHLEPLTVHDREDALGFGNRLAHLRQLLQGRDSRLVREIVLAPFHDFNAQRRALIRNLRAQHQLNCGIVQDLLLRLHDLHIGKSLLERRKPLLFATPGRHQFAAPALNRADHSVDVVVTDSADGKLDVILRRLVGIL